MWWLSSLRHPSLRSRETLFGTSARKNTLARETGRVLWIGKVCKLSLLLRAVLRRAHADALRALRRAGGNIATRVATAAPASCSVIYEEREEKKKTRRVAAGKANRQIIRRQQPFYPHPPPGRPLRWKHAADGAELLAMILQNLLRNDHSSSSSPAAGSSVCRNATF